MENNIMTSWNTIIERSRKK